MKKRRVRSGPSMAEFLHYYLLVLLAKKPQTRQELVKAIKQDSADNRSYRPGGVLWVAAAEMDKSLRVLERDGLVRQASTGRWRITAQGRQRRWQYEQEHAEASASKEQAADKLLTLMGQPQPGNRVLDVGTGQGFLAFKLAEAGFEVLGIDSGSFDYSKDSVRNAAEQARERSATAEFRQADLLELSEPDSSFDYIVSSQAIHCMNDQAACISAMYRLLKPVGQFLCLDFAVGLTGFLAHGFHGFLAISREEWEELLAECGFQDVKFNGVEDYLVVETQKPN